MAPLSRIVQYQAIPIEQEDITKWGDKPVHDCLQAIEQVYSNHRDLKATVLPANTSAQKAELIVLTRALEIAEEKWANIYADSKYASGVIHAHGVIWKERE